MIQQAFQHRSGRVIALGRLVLAAVFLLAIWLDPSQPNQQPGVVYTLLLAYVVWAAALLGLIWKNWWLDFRLAASAHLLDIAAFGVLVFSTEGYTSPFYTFFVFLLLSSAIRWSWRETALTAAAVLAVFVVAGAAAFALTAAEVDLQRLVVRSAYLVVLSLLFIWFGINQLAVPVSLSTEPEPRADSESPPILPAMRQAATRMRARRILLLWWQKEEPWLNIAEIDDDSLRTERTGPEAFGRRFSDEADGRPFLFDAARGAGLCRKAGAPAHLRGFRQTIDGQLLERLRANEGLVIRVRAKNHEGEMFVLDVEGLCADDLKPAEALGLEISAMFDRLSMAVISEEAAVNRARASLARDLHDSVVQVLAGGAFRLEALKSWIRAGENPEAEIDVIKREFAAEQRNVRSFIARLRGGRDAIQPTNLCAKLPDLTELLRRRWTLDFELSCARETIIGSTWMEHELHQIVGEAAANAARHGKATAMSISLAEAGGELVLSIADNGIGFAAAAADNGGTAPAGPVRPWSVHERVSGLGGTLSLESGAGGSQLSIRVPLGDGL